MSTFYHRHPGLRLTNVEGEGIVLHLDTRRYFSVNETGLLILEALFYPQSADELVETVLERYDAAPEYVRECIVQFLAHCQGGELIVRHNSA